MGIEGASDPLATTVFLLIAIQVFDLPNHYKAWIIASKFIAFLLCPFVLRFFAMLPWKRSSIAGLCNIVSSLFLLCASITNSTLIYTLSCCIFLLCFNIKLPLLAQIYRENYSANLRGRLFSYGAAARHFFSLAFNLTSAFLLDQQIIYYQGIYTVYAILLFISGILCYWIPSQTIQKKEIGNSWDQISIALRDKLFLYICFAWYLIGFGNLWLSPMRVEHLTGASGMIFSTLQILLVLQIVPGIVRIIVSWFGGKLFDHLPLLSFRVGVNILFMLGTITFFNSKTLWGLLLGGIFFGSAEAGANFIWNLWVTNLAPKKEQVQHYMNVHLFLTGSRGLVGPFLSYTLLQNNWSSRGLSNISVGLMLLSTLLFISMIRNPRINKRI